MKFRKQVVLGGRYIADLVAPAKRLVVKVDGAPMPGCVQADARKDRVLQRLGYRVLRLERGSSSSSPSSCSLAFVEPWQKARGTQSSSDD